MVVCTKQFNNRGDKIVKKVFCTCYFWIYSILLIMIVVSFGLIGWANNIFQVGIEEILYTISSPLVGSDVVFFLSACPYLIITLGISILLIILFAMIEKRIIQLDKDLIIMLRFREIIVLAGMCVYVSLYADSSFHILKYFDDKNHQTTIYQEYYIDPNEISLSAENSKNIIYIYLESMETTYASIQDGGANKENYIKNLTELANNNVSFSDSSKLGGWHATSGTEWTMGALFATQSGIPFSFPVEGNDMGSRKAFASGTTTLGDILAQNGYYNEFICGSKGKFAGRSTFFKQHGSFNIVDYNRIRKMGYFDPDRFVFWGCEDRYTYQVAKDRLMRISSQEQPFNVVMLTVDTHHVSGYVCDLCESKYDEQLANVLDCADKQLLDFVNWCKEQDWYDDTIIVITGDHPRMDTDLVDGINYYDRTVYNCFLNVDEDIKNSATTKNRVFVAMDMMPTVLAAAGFKIEGDRIALGTNLFSNRPTLCEELGYDYVSSETSKYSEYYISAFK